MMLRYMFIWPLGVGSDLMQNMVSYVHTYDLVG